MNLRGATLLLCAVASLSGCRMGGGSPPVNSDRFPIGLFGLMEARFLKDVQAAGFDSVKPGDKSAEGQTQIALAAKKLGMRIVAHPHAMSKNSVDLTSDWPLEAWYIAGEPFVNHHDAAWLEEVSRRFRKWDPHRPQTFVVNAGTRAAAYGHIAEVLMLDWYPVPLQPLDGVAKHIDIALKYLPKEKPLWFVVQAYDWGDWPHPKGRKWLPGRYPSHQEIRFMSYIAIVHGVDGLFYFTFKKPGGKNLLDFPEHWQALTRVTKEIKALQPIFETGQEITFPESLGNGPLEGKAWNYRGKQIAILVNRSSSTADFPRGFLDKSWRPLFETRRNPKNLLVSTNNSLMMPGHRVIVFERSRR